MVWNCVESVEVGVEFFHSIVILTNCIFSGLGMCYFRTGASVKGNMRIKNSK